MNEDTIFRDMDLPEDLGRDWEWFGDLNIVGLRRGMNWQEKIQAVEDLQCAWRRAHLNTAEIA